MNGSLAGLLISVALAVGYLIGYYRGLQAAWRDARRLR